jgi:hypothetical protein
MADIKFNCQGCQGSIIIDGNGAGLTVECPHCSRTITVPSASPAGNLHQLPAAQAQIPRETHAIQSGVCARCGQSETDINHFGWLCIRKDPLQIPREAHTINNGYCSTCGQSETSIIQYGWLCRPKSPPPSQARSPLGSCRVCGKDVSPSAQTCPHCGEYAPAVSKQCPNCRSTRVTAFEGSHFGIGKAAAGAVVLGPLGLLAGLLPTRSTFFRCLNCGAEFM